VDPRRLLRGVLVRTGRALVGLGEGLYRTPLERRVLEWQAADGDRRLRLDYDLDAGSLALDLGGYQGQWASDVVARFGCAVQVFEPVPEFAAAIRRRFERNPRVTVHEFGLGARDQEIAITLAADGSSAYRTGSSPVKGRLVRAADFMAGHGISRVDLMKVNVEGGEFDLLDHLLEQGLMERIANLQVQFHDVVPDAVRRRKAIQERLARTHELAWQFEWVWESWRLRGDAGVSARRS
jgi:FkbM family methyltransferase